MSASELKTDRRRFDIRSPNILNPLLVLSEGNPGALSVIDALFRRDCGPLGAMMTLLNADDMNIRGAQIWVAFKDVCAGDLDVFIERVERRDAELVASVNAIIPEGERAVTSGASYAHR